MQWNKKGFSKYFLGFKKIFWKNFVQPTITHQNRVILVMVKYFFNIHKKTLLCLIYTRIIKSIWELFWMILQSKSMNVIVWLNSHSMKYQSIYYKLGQHQSQTPFSSAFWVQKNFRSKNILGPKNFGSKNFESEKNFEFRKFCIQRILSPKILGLS